MSNVSSIEEDIKIVKELLKGAKDYGQYNGNKYFYSIENIIQEYTRQKQINEEHKKENVKLMKALNVVEKEKGEWIEDCNDLKKKVKELEEQVEYDKTHIYTPMTIQLNYILKRKIEDKIEELKEENYQISLESKVVFDTGIMKNNFKIQVLKELLQEGNK